MAANGSVMAACEQPADPTIPDGSTATGAEMINAKKAVTEYLAASELFLACSESGDLKQNLSDRMDNVIETFNNSLIAYSKVPNAAIRFSANALAKR